MTKTLSILIFLTSSIAIASEQAPSQNYQLVSGNCNLLINAPQGAETKIPPTRICSDLSSTASVADSLKKIERFIEASNPTEVTISDAGLIKWAGDSEDYLTLTLLNVSALPAEKVKIRMLDVVKANEKNSRTLSFYPSKSFPKAALDNLGIPKGRTVQIPVASASEVEGVSRSRVSSGLEFIGAGLSPNLPSEIKEQYIHNKGFLNNFQFEGEAISLGVELKYTNIFGGNSTALTGIYLYFGKVSRI